MKFCQILFALFLTGSGAWAAIKDQPLTIKPNEAILEVGGIVCQFCAIGLNNNLGDLPLLDRKKLRNGLFIDIRNNRVILALKPNEPVNYQKVRHAITRGGYELLSMHVWLRGQLRKHDGRWFLHEQGNQREYRVIDSTLEGVPENQPIAVQAEMCGKCLPGLQPGQPYLIKIHHQHPLRP